MQVEDNRLSTMKRFFEKSMRHSIYPQEEWRSLFQRLAEDLIGLDRLQITLAEDTKLTESQILRFLNAIKALKAGTPLQYIIGHTSFCGLRLLTQSGTLIPRPETEELVHWIHSEQQNAQAILDIGTGTGCIALALKSKLPSARIQAIEVDDTALEIARENQRATGLDIQLVQDDILRPEGNYESFDVIVSNPPYVLESDKQAMRENVLAHEPHQALFVRDEDPLVFYRAILDFAVDHLKENGSIYWEIHEEQGEAIRELCMQKDFKDVIIRRDMQGKDRMVKASRE
ncbi:MAG: peptide chain release factor N(5)-glutamine methyltransferase [Flavobacteriales bacterium]|nr:peptide chain release factor N(5)-glutamine methyltransferase [Flavobacteriales bacterium]